MIIEIETTVKVTVNVTEDDIRRWIVAGIKEEARTLPDGSELEVDEGSISFYAERGSFGELKELSATVEYEEENEETY